MLFYAYAVLVVKYVLVGWCGEFNLFNVQKEQFSPYLFTSLANSRCCVLNYNTGGVFIFVVVAFVGNMDIKTKFFIGIKLEERPYGS